MSRTPTAMCDTASMVMPRTLLRGRARAPRRYAEEPGRELVRAGQRRQVTAVHLVGHDAESLAARPAAGTRPGRTGRRDRAGTASARRATRRAATAPRTTVARLLVHVVLRLAGDVGRDVVQERSRPDRRTRRPPACLGVAGVHPPLAGRLPRPRHHRRDQDHQVDRHPFAHERRGEPGQRLRDQHEVASGRRPRRPRSRRTRRTRPSRRRPEGRRRRRRALPPRRSGTTRCQYHASEPAPGRSTNVATSTARPARGSCEAEHRAGGVGRGGEPAVRRVLGRHHHLAAERHDLRQRVVGVVDTEVHRPARRARPRAGSRTRPSRPRAAPRRRRAVV